MKAVRRFFGTSFKMILAVIAICNLVALFVFNYQIPDAITSRIPFLKSSTIEENTATLYLDQPAQTEAAVPSGKFHIEVPDTYSADQLDQLIREIQMEVYAKHNVILTAIGVYSVNTRDKEVIETQKKVRDIVFKNPYVRQMHGFYLLKNEKAMRFDIVVSFDAKDRYAVYEEVISNVQKEFPDYKLVVTMDTDFAEE